MTQEVLKLAENYAKNRANYHIESLYGTNESYTATIKKAMLEAHQALKEALAQTQQPDVQETLHWHAFNYRQAHTSQAHEMWQQLEQFVDSKIKAPQRTWVGLTDEDICTFSMWLDDKSDVAVFTAIEAKLKELNT